ncbi:hypothetical protein BH24ACT26_BH24ACT26_06170 [soil metagenome]
MGERQSAFRARPVGPGRAEIHLLGGHSGDFTESIEGDDLPITKVKPGGASQPRYQRRAENNWEGNAKEVAGEVINLVRSEGIELVVVAGDVRAIGFLKEQLEGVQEIIAVDIGSPPAVSLEDIREELDGVVAAYTAQTTEDVLAKFREERGQRDLAVEGMEATLGALRMAQVETVLLARDISGGSAWFSPSDPTQAALDRKTLTDLGLDDATEARVAEVLARAALGTGAHTIVIPALSEEHGPRQGVGALLRFRIR